MRVALSLAPLLAALWSLAATPSENVTSGEMRPIEVNSYKLVDAEYLPFVGSTPLRYPEDVLWGFYAEGSTDAAQACALAAFRQVRAIFTENLPELRDAVRLGATRFFYLWINDYTVADAGRSRRSPQVWHWGVPSNDYGVGYWKWEATVSQSGVCYLPRRDEIRRVFQAVIDAQDAPVD